MSIIKNNLLQIILVGLLFALISGSFSFFAYDGLVKKEKNLEKQIVIINVKRNNSLLLGIQRLTPNISSQIKEINRELFESLKYSLVRYQRDPRLSSGCYRMQKELNDNSIVIETKVYPVEKKEKMNQCLKVLFDLSFIRLKEKLVVNTNEEIIKTKFKVDDFDLYEDYKNIDDVDKEFIIEKKFVSKTLQEQMCKEFEPIFTSVLDGYDFISEEKRNEISSENMLNDMLSIPKLFKNLSELVSLSKDCDQLKLNANELKISDNRYNKLLKQSRDRKLENLLKTQSGLTDALKILLGIGFKDVFKIEKLIVVEKNPEVYLTKKNILTSFTLLGFLFGVLLVYNFRISK